MHISFKKYKQYLEFFGYVQEKGTNEYYDLGFITYFFSKPNEKLKYAVNVFINSDIIMAINHGYGSLYLGWQTVKIDKRKKFWKNLMID